MAIKSGIRIRRHKMWKHMLHLIFHMWIPRMIEVREISCVQNLRFLASNEQIKY